MKITYYTPTEIDLEIEEISLLTVEEANELPEEIRLYDASWWLRSPGIESYYVAIIYYDGVIDPRGDYVGFDTYAIRPVLTIPNLESLNLRIGDMLTIQSKEYRYIGASKVLYNDKVIHHRFNAGSGSNDYEQSEVKQIVDNWLK